MMSSNRKVVFGFILLLVGGFAALYACTANIPNATYWAVMDAYHGLRWEAAVPPAMTIKACSLYTPFTNAQPKYWIDGHMHQNSAVVVKTIADSQFSWNKSNNLRREVLLMSQSTWNSDRTEILQDDRLIPFLYMGGLSEMTASNAQTLYNQGIKGIKLHNRGMLVNGGVCIEDLESPTCMAFYAKCAELGLPICWHYITYIAEADRPSGATLPFTAADLLNQMIRICKANPTLHLYCAHLADLAESKLDSVLDITPNLMVDGSSYCKLNKFYWWTCTWQDTLRKFYINHSKQVIMGTDFYFDNNNLSGARYEYENFFLKLDLPQSKLEDIAHGNIERICHLTEYPASINEPEINSANTGSSNGMLGISMRKTGNSTADFQVSLARPGDCRVTVYSIAGQKLWSRSIAGAKAGQCTVEWKSQNRNINGIYFVTLEQNGLKISQRFLAIQN